MAMGDLASATKKFGLELAGRLQPDAAGNLFISPLSAEMSLGMAAIGARGKTQQSMLATLGMGSTSPQLFAEQASELLASLSGPECGSLEIGNSLWVRQGFPLASAYLQQAAESFRAEAHELDFSSPAAPSTINAWVDRATHGMIPSIVDHLDATEVLDLINATYFKGDWQQPFDPAATAEASFHLAAGRSATVPLMNRSGFFDYGEGPGYQAVGLPYRGSALRMLVVLPRETLGAQQLATAYLDPARLDAVRSSLQPRRQGSLSLPRFSLDYSSGLVDALRQMGMGSAFAADADFTAISPSCEFGCSISNVLQKARLEIDETGTRAAAATRTSVVATSAVVQRGTPFRMVVDHPFLLAIEAPASGALLFVGLVGNPS